MLTELQAKVHASRSILQHVAYVHFAHPLVASKYITLLQRALNNFEASLDAVIPELRRIFDNAQNPGEFQEALTLARKTYEPAFCLIHNMIVHLLASTVPSSPHWLHYFLDSRLSEIEAVTGNAGGSRIHLSSSAIHLQEGYGFFYISASDDLERLDRSLAKIHKELRLSAPKAIVSAGDPSVLLQYLPWFAEMHPHIMAIMLHELGHHVYRVFCARGRSSDADEISLRVKEYTDRTPVVQKQSEDILRAIISKHLRELFADAFAIWAVGIAAYATYRDDIAVLSVLTDPFEAIHRCADGKEPEAPVDVHIAERCCTFSPIHPPTIVRLVLMAQLIGDSGGDSRIEGQSLLGKLHRQALQCDVESLHNSIRDVILRRSLELPDFAFDPDAKIDWDYVLAAVTSLGKSAYALARDVCESRMGMSFPRLSQGHLDAAFNCINNCVPATGVVSATKHPVALSLAIGHELHRRHYGYLLDKQGYLERVAVLNKTLEDTCLRELYGTDLFN